MSDRFDYGQNPEKTLDGALIRSYECDPLTADSEFLLSKARYKSITGREQKRDADVLCYQIRQSFPPGELDPEEADWDDSLAVDSFTFWEEQAVASERIAAAPRIAKYVFFIVHYQPFF